MLNREEIEQMIDKKLEPITEEVATLKAQLSKVDLLFIDNRNIRQSLGRIENAQEGFKTAQEGLKLDFERQEKRTIRFEKQTNDQFTGLKADITDLKADVTGLKADNIIIKEQLSLVVTMLRRVLPPEEQR